ncbi:MAG: hypothetical protein KTR31_13215 [Myxococcales bacterium]|nr:hypothetical protein [Myxococcales bacterium]
MVLWFLAGCPLITSGHLDELRDFDQDGFDAVAFGGQDCDDDDPTVYPAAPDAWYDGRIQDCNRADDFDQDADGVPTPIDCDDTDPTQVEPPQWHPDLDGDGFGDREFSVAACEAPGRGVADGTDCDDTDPEVGDSIRYYEDVDEDGFGNPERFVDRCIPPANQPYSLLEGDCDDADADENPQALWGWDADCDGHGDPAVQLAQCEIPEPLGGLCPSGAAADWVADQLEDCDDTRSDVYPGAPGEVWKDGIDTDCADDTDLDGPDLDTLTDLPLSAGCASTVGTVIRIPQDHVDLQEAIDAAAPCDVIEIGDVEVGNAVVDRPVAIVAAPTATPRVVAEPVDDVGIEVARDQSVTLEGLTFEGFPTGVWMRGRAELLAGDLTFDGGVGIDGLADSRLELYDQTFVDTDVAVQRGVGTYPFDLHRCVVEGALAARDVLSLRGPGPVAVTGCTFQRSSVAQGAIVRVDAAEVTLSDLVFDDNVGMVLDVDARRGGSSPADYTLQDVTLIRNVSVAPVMMSVAANGAGHADVSGLVLRDNVWAVPLGGVVTNLPESLVLFEDVAVTLTGAVFRGNVLERQGPQLRLTGANVVGSSSDAFELRSVEISGDGGTGVELDGGRLTNVSVVGLSTGIQSKGPVVLDSAILALNGRAVRLQTPDDPDEPAPTVTSSYSLYYNNLINGPFLDGGNNIVGSPPRFVRYFPGFPADLWDLRLIPDLPDVSVDGSPCVDAGNTADAGADPDGSDNDCGAFGGPDSDGTLVEDLDGDSLYDDWEREWLGDPSVDDGTGDPDGDGLNTRWEFARGTLPNVADTDGDGVIDSKDGCPLDVGRDDICVLPVPGF